MKRIITVIILAALMVSAAAYTGCAASERLTYKTRKAGKAYVTKFYAGGHCVGKVKTKKKLKVRYYDSEQVNYELVAHRKNRFILVERIYGECINNKGDGRTTDGYYISYRCIDYEVGAKYTTYCVYANNNGEDDIVIRADFDGWK